MQISSSDTVITREYTYNNWPPSYGVHTVSVRGFNLVNSHTLSADVDVIDWPCQAPNVTLAPAFIDPGFPPTVDGKDGFTVTATFAVDCMKNERFTAQWDLLDSNQVVVRTLSNATQWISDPHTLSAGMYELIITASLWSSRFDLSHKTVTFRSCINVTTTGLVAGIEGSSFISATFNDSVQLSTYDQTYDLSIPSTSDKSGMVIEWRCKRSSETWPIQMATQTYVPYSGTGGGCFGDVGAGVLGFAAGLWDLIIDTSYLEPLINYDIQFVVTKDVRSASADVTLFVQQPLAPVVGITLVTYTVTRCNTKMLRLCTFVGCTFLRMRLIEIWDRIHAVYRYHISHPDVICLYIFASSLLLCFHVSFILLLSSPAFSPLPSLQFSFLSNFPQCRR